MAGMVFGYKSPQRSVHSPQEEEIRNTFQLTGVSLQFTVKYDASLKIKLLKTVNF